MLLRLAEHGADMDMPRVTFDTEVDGIPAWTPLSLRTLTERVAARAEWFARHGIGRRDPVAVYVTSAADVFLNFFALTWLGAIPALMNGSMPTEIAVEFIRRLRAVGVLPDADHAGLAGRDLGAPVLGYAAQTGTGDPAAAPPHYRHHQDDPVAITHSSGTTRMPAAVVHSHHSLFAAVRAVRLTEPRQHGPVRELSAFPQAHTAGIIIVNEALCNGYELAVPVGAGRRVRAQRRGDPRRHRAVAADGGLRLRRHLGRTGPLRPDRSRRQLGAVLVQQRRLRARGAYPPPGRRRQSPCLRPAARSSACPGPGSTTRSARPRWATAVS